ncbi:MAG: FecR family protein [Nitrospirota bacterium]
MVQKQVHVTHTGQDQILLVKAGDGVLFMDTYETQAESRAKLLFEDDSLLTLGEKTKLQITEHVYDPAENRRRTIMKILSGRARVLVGKVFSGAGSKFEIHTPTAVAAARGTYYIVYLFERAGHLMTGVLSLAGEVDVRNTDASIRGVVKLRPNQYTIVGRGSPPVAAALMDPGLSAELQSSTEVEEEREEAIPSDIQEPSADLVADTVPEVTVEVQPAPPATVESGVPSVPPIAQQPVPPTTPVHVEIQFPQ